MYAIIDCDNCFVSCERVFRPDLNGKPVVVLSNNDGCVVARSNEAKQMGIKMGMPYYQLRQQYTPEQVYAFSSNYELYAEMTARVMSIVTDECPSFYRYSIDEAFCILDGFDRIDLKQWGEQLRQRILTSTSMPVSIGIAPTKTLAKCAAYFAKRYAGYNHCAVIDSPDKRVKALQHYPIDEVWGIGRRYAKQMTGHAILTAYDFTQRSREWVKRTFTIGGERTWRELQGDDCIPTEVPQPKQSICTSRSFPKNISSKTDIHSYIATFAAKCAEKLRAQHSVARKVTVFLETNRFRTDLPQYANSATVELLTPDNASQVIVASATKALDILFREGFEYKRAGVVVNDISEDTAVQTNLFDYDSLLYSRRHKLDEVVDKINRLHGQETVALASQGVFRKSVKRDLKSPDYTTMWSDIIQAN